MPKPGTAMSRSLIAKQGPPPLVVGLRIGRPSSPVHSAAIIWKCGWVKPIASFATIKTRAGLPAQIALIDPKPLSANSIEGEGASAGVRDAGDRSHNRRSFFRGRPHLASIDRK